MSSIPPEQAARWQALQCCVGNTPLLSIRCRLEGVEHTVYAKLETLNFTGSIKDRMALHMLGEAYARGLLKPEDTIVEASSGNTGISFAALGRALGHPVRIYMPDWMSRERTDLIRNLGAEIVPVSSSEGGFVGSVELADEYAAQHPGCFRPQQFKSLANSEAHRLTTARELDLQLASNGLRPDAFVAGVGTGGTVMGLKAYFAEHFPAATLHPLEPANSPTLRTGTKVGSHRIQGISDEFIPGLVLLDELDEIVDVWDGDSIIMAQRLASELGLAVGISSGANLIGALKLARELGPQSVVATVFADSNKKYLSTDLCRVEPGRDDYLCQHVELLEFHASPRVDLV